MPGHDDASLAQQQAQCSEVLQSLLRWVYTGRLAVLRHAASACASACSNIQAHELAESLHEAIHAEGRLLLSTLIRRVYHCQESYAGHRHHVWDH